LREAVNMISSRKGKNKKKSSTFHSNKEKKGQRTQRRRGPLAEKTIPKPTISLKKKVLRLREGKKNHNNQGGKID